MDFKDQIKLLSERVIKLKENTQTEEATKTAFIMPFLQTLGYDVFDPTEVVPEYTCDLGIKKGEKIDYAIHKDGQPIILIECKHWKEDLTSHNGQLFRYFHVSNARFGILTNGIIYRFYTDLVEKNKMDEKPFFEFNMEKYRESQVDKLREFHKSYFDVDTILNTASELKFTNEIRNAIDREINKIFDNNLTTFAKMQGRRSNTRTTHDAVKRHRYKDINLFSTDKTEYEKTSRDDSCADCNDAEPTQVLRCRILFDLFRACVFLFVRRGLFVGGFA